MFNIQRLHKSPTELNIVYTGGGSKFVTALLHEKGASNTVLEATCTYSPESTMNYLKGYKPEKFVSIKTARHLSIMAFARGLDLCTTGSENLIGLSITASLHYPDQREGRLNQAYIGMCGDGFTKVYHIDFTFLESRSVQDQHLATLLIDVLNNEGGMLPVQDTTKFDRIYSGAFNPLHEGHKTIYNNTGNCVYELPLRNADKGEISLQSLSDRVSQFSADDRLVVSTRPTFIQKDSLYHKVLERPATFVVGADTAERIFERDGGCNAEFLVYGKGKEDVTLSPKCYVSNLEVPDIRSSHFRQAEARIHRESSQPHEHSSDANNDMENMR